MKTKKAKYEVRFQNEWLKCKKAAPQTGGWLHYELYDGTNGLKRPGTWRVRLMQAEEIETQE